MEASARSYKDLVLATRPFAVEDPRRSWFFLLSSLLYTALAFRLTLADLPLAVRVCASVLAALLMVRVFVIFHDHEHGAILRNSRVAKRLMSALGILFLRSSAEWRETHNFHHRHNGRLSVSSTGAFPTKTAAEWAGLGRGQRLAYRIVRSPWVIVFAYVTCYLVECLKKVCFRRGRLRVESCAALAVHAVIVGLAWRAGWDTLLLSVLVPYFFACMVGVYLFYVQHNFEGARFKPEAEWDAGYAALHSSSCLRCGPIAHWFTANIGYHHIHHLNHKIPFYRLPEAMRALPELQKPVFVALTPRSICRTLKLKLWSQERLKMVGFYLDGDQ